MRTHPPDLSFADAVAALHALARLNRRAPDGDAPLRLPDVEARAEHIVDAIESAPWLSDAPRAGHQDYRIAGRLGLCRVTPR